MPTMYIDVHALGLNRTHHGHSSASQSQSHRSLIRGAFHAPLGISRAVMLILVMVWSGLVWSGVVWC